MRIYLWQISQNYEENSCRIWAGVFLLPIENRNKSEYNKSEFELAYANSKEVTYR